MSQVAPTKVSMLMTELMVYKRCCVVGSTTWAPPVTPGVDIFPDPAERKACSVSDVSLLWNSRDDYVLLLATTLNIH